MSDGTLRWRLRRAGLRWARRVWWALPANVRSRLRPIVSRRGRRRPAAGSEPFYARPPLSEGRPTAAARPIPAIDVPVSVVVPTLDAGRDAALFLAAFARQEGIRELELVVADSGSTDGTRERFAAAADVALDIPAGEFGHGRTRNEAFAASSGDVVVMMAQDALLLGPFALRDLVLELLANDRLAAVSARHVPRSDADLFAAFTVVSHYRALWWEGRRAHPSEPLRRRADAGVDDVCVAIRRSVWEDGIQYRDIDFGEDLDFGMRAVSAGWTVALSDTAAVAHSHTRDAPYHFRRSAADRLHVAALVGDDAVCRSATIGEVAEIIAAGRALLSGIATSGESRLLDQLQRVATSREAANAPLRGQLALLDEFLAGLGEAPVRDDVSAALRGELVALLEWPLLVEFAAAQRGTSPEEGGDFVAKLAASVVGRAVGDRLRFKESPGDRERLLVGV
jgi:rhamnosyltransferase